MHSPEFWPKTATDTSMCPPTAIRSSALVGEPGQSATSLPSPEDWPATSDSTCATLESHSLGLCESQSGLSEPQEQSSK
jgi:hypothetical protein